MQLDQGLQGLGPHSTEALAVQMVEADSVKQRVSWGLQFKEDRFLGAHLSCWDVSLLLTVLSSALVSRDRLVSRLECWLTATNNSESADWSMIDLQFMQYQDDEDPGG